MRMILIVMLFWGTAAFAQQGQEQVDANALQSFIRNASGVCATKRAQSCVDAAWNFAVPASSNGLTLPDLQSLRQRVGSWFGRYQGNMSTQEKNSVALGLLVADGLGMNVLHNAFDTNRDGRVTKQELLADVTLDERPLGSVLTDGKAVNRAGLARKLGLPAAYMDALFP